MLCSVLQCSAVQCIAVQCSAVQCCAECSEVSCSAVQCSGVQCSAVQCNVVQCSVVQCSAVSCSALQCSDVLYVMGTVASVNCGWLGDFEIASLVPKLLQSEVVGWDRGGLCKRVELALGKSVKSWATPCVILVISIHYYSTVGIFP